MSRKNYRHHIWVSQEAAHEYQDELSSSLSISPIFAQILAGRGLTTPFAAMAFLSADRSSLCDYALLPDINAAAARINRALADHEKIVVFGDFDVDGVTSTALMLELLRSQGADADFYIPLRTEEGYGLSKDAISKIAATGANLIITVDCGINAVAEADFATELGLELLITDHHEPTEHLPTAVAVVDPKRQDSKYPFYDLAGVGVAFQLAAAVMGDIDKVWKYADLAAIGTVADIVPLQEDNRIIVREGLTRLRSSPRPGLKALAEVIGLQIDKINAEHLAYMIGPRLNAAGRLDSAEQALRLLLTQDAEEAMLIARSLHERNRERQMIEQEIFEQAIAMHEAEAKSDDAIVLFDENWHEGVKGIVASRLAEKYHRPAVVFSKRNGLLIGSARSIPGIHLYEAINSQSEALESFGGHEHAAGLSCKPENLDDFINGFRRYVRDNLTDEIKQPKLHIDAWVMPRALTMELASELKQLEPFGAGNVKPIFAAASLKPQSLTKLSGGKHVKFDIAGACEAKAIFFGPESDDIETILMATDRSSETHIDAAFMLETSEFRGRLNLDARVIAIRRSETIGGDEFIDSLFLNADKTIQREEYKNIGESSLFHTKIAGVSFDNRQEVIRDLGAGVALKLLREPDNVHDPNAIRIITKSGLDIGFLNARLAKQLAPYIDRGETYEAVITDVTGGGDNLACGVNIEVRKLSEDSSALDTSVDIDERKRLASYDDDILWRHLSAIMIDSEPRPEQQDAWSHLGSGKNCLIIMGTGRGKSAVFQVFAAWQAIRMNQASVFIYPLRALVSDQLHFLRQRMGGLGISAIYLTGDLSPAQRQEQLGLLETGAADIVLTTPEFIHFHIDRFAKISDRIGFLVIDEAHHICTSTESHRPIYKQLSALAESLASPQILAATATADDQTTDAIVKELAIDKIIIDPTVRSNLHILDTRGCTDKQAYLESNLTGEDKAVIYVNSREQSVELARDLRIALPQCRNAIAYYNAGLDSASRGIIEDRFRTGSLMLVVATSAFGEGINIQDIRHVVHYHMNFNSVEFNQQSGRAGRDGVDSYIHLIFNEDDARINQMILESSAPSRSSLAELYRTLERLARSGGDPAQIAAGNEEIARAIEDLSGCYLLNELGVESGLKIIEELGLIALRSSGPHRRISLLPKPEQKLDLFDSLRYQEGEDEKQLFEDFRKWVFAADADNLLDAVNQPIYPRALEVGQT